jgi:hypothetical protein
MLTINLDPPNFAYAAVSDVYGGKHIHVQISPDVIDAFNWIQTYRALLDREVKLRETNPALANQWDHYQTMLKIVMDDV